MSSKASAAEPPSLHPRRAWALAPTGATLEAVDWRAMACELDQWARLVELAVDPNPFFEPWYLLPSLEAFDSDRKVKLLRLETNGALLGLMPVARSSRYYGRPVPHIASWLHPNLFLGAPLVARGSEEQFWTALLQWADSNAGMALFLHLSQMPLTGPLTDALRRVLRDQGRSAAIVYCEERAMLASSLSREAYFEASLSTKKRKELRRQFSRLNELGELRFSRSEGDDELDSWTGEFLALEALGWKGAAGSALACSRETSELFRKALTGAATQGRLERIDLRLDGAPIAMLVNFMASPGAFSFKTAFDERYSRYSPGVLLQRENLDLLDRPEIDWCDSCAAADHPMIDHVWRERRKIGRLSIAIGGSLRRQAFKRILGLELGRNRQANRLSTLSQAIPDLSKFTKEQTDESAFS